MFATLIRAWAGLAVLTVLASCAATGSPDNLEEVSRGGGYQAQYRSPDVSRAEAAFLRSASMNAARCLPARGGPLGKGVPAGGILGEQLSRNDLLDVRVGSDETFTGRYVVSRDGRLKLPFLPEIIAQGRSSRQVEMVLVRHLLNEGFYDDAPPVSVRVADFSSVTIGVSGAVFEPHQVEIGRVSGDDRDQERQQALGASTEARNLSAALRAGGGIRPDADLSAVELRRGGRLYVLDLRPLFEGQTAHDIMMLSGDMLHVPSRQCFQEDLMRPSPISPPGVRMFLSNLTQPATSNASSAIGREVREMPYGTRYLQAVVDANCVGGARASSAHRSAVLISRSPLSGVSSVIERDIEDLLRRADRDDFDPYILPGDALACYDSTITNLTEVGRALGLITLGALVD